MIGSLFICSATRSGSTLLDRLLGVHPLALPVGELHQLPKNLALNSVCSCGEPARNCAFWRPVVQRAGEIIGADLWRDPYALGLGYIKSGVEVDRERHGRAYRLLRSFHLRYVELMLKTGADPQWTPGLGGYASELRNHRMLHDVLREVSSKRLVVDSSKGFRYGVGVYRLDPGGTRLVLLSRDGRGVMASKMRSGLPRNVALAQWVNYYARALPWIERYVDPSHVLRLRYEDLVADPQREVARVLEFAGLDATEMAPIGEATEPHILNGNPMRHESLAKIRPDERWMRELTSDDLAYFQRHGLAMSRRLGYPSDDDVETVNA
jgi:hypothetical protein